MQKTIYDDGYRQLISGLKVARVAAGLTQAQAAQRVGKGRNWISKIERFELRLDVLYFSRLCRAYGVSAEELIRQLNDGECP